MSDLLIIQIEDDLTVLTVDEPNKAREFVKSIAAHAGMTVRYAMVVDAPNMSEFGPGDVFDALQDGPQNDEDPDTATWNEVTA